MRAIRSSQVQFEFTSLHYDGCNFGGLYLSHQMFVFNKNCWVLFPIKPSYCGEIFMSIQVVLNVWEHFEVQNPDIFALQWTSAAYNFFIHGPFSIIFVGKVAHTGLVYKNKISYESKRLWVTEKHFSRGRFIHWCDFLLLFSLFFDISKQFCRHNESIEWDFFSPKCLSFGLNHFVV